MAPSFLCTFAGTRLAEPTLAFSWLMKVSRPGWLELPIVGNTPLSFHCRERVIFKVVFLRLHFLFSFTNAHFFSISSSEMGFWEIISSHPTYLYASGLLFGFPHTSYHCWPLCWRSPPSPFTLLNNWLCIQHKSLPNCPSQHELLSYSASFCSPSFSTIK